MEATETATRPQAADPVFVDDGSDANIDTIRQLMGIDGGDPIPDETIRIYQSAKMMLNRAGSTKFGPDALAILAAVSKPKAKAK